MRRGEPKNDVVCLAHFGLSSMMVEVRIPHASRLIFLAGEEEETPSSQEDECVISMGPWARSCGDHHMRA